MTNNAPTKQSRVDKLKEIIQAANSEIMELKIGCDVMVAEDVYTVHLVYDKLRAWRGAKDSSTKVEQFPISVIGKILGRPIRLADIFITLANQEKLSRDAMHLVVANWELAEDNLENQSDECIQFLYELLKEAGI